MTPDELAQAILHDGYNEINWDEAVRLIEESKREWETAVLAAIEDAILAALPDE